MVRVKRKYNFITVRKCYVREIIDYAGHNNVFTDTKEKLEG